jgi:hypothetical protein
MQWIIITTNNIIIIVTVTITTIATQVSGVYVADAVRLLNFL